MRHVALKFSALAPLVLAPLTMPANAEPFVIDQSAWANYAIIVNTSRLGSDLLIRQHGTKNAVSSIQLSGEYDAAIATSQKGRRNSAFTYQAGWNTFAQVVQSGPEASSGARHMPTRFFAGQTDEGYLAYFMSGGFSMVTLTDQNHTWFSRFGRSR